MTVRAAASLAAITVLCAGCGGSARAGFAAVHVHQSAAQVRAAMGEPDRRRGAFWLWRRGGTLDKVELRQGRVVLKAHCPHGGLCIVDESALTG